MAKILAVAITIPIFAILMLLINFPVMWAGNRFLLDIGLENADYWSWFWITLVFGFVFGSNSSSRKGAA